MSRKLISAMNVFVELCLKNAGGDGAKRDSIYEYLKDVLPQNKTEEQKLRYVGRLLVEMNGDKSIGKIGLKWILK